MKKKILVVGGGGREHAIIKALKKSPDCGEVWCAPGNGGISYDARCKNIKAKMCIRDSSQSHSVRQLPL